VLSVSRDTLSVVNEMEDVVKEGRKPDASLVETVRELLVQHADVEALLGP